MKKNKVLSLVLCLALALPMFTSSALAEEKKPEGPPVNTVYVSADQKDEVLDIDPDAKIIDTDVISGEKKLEVRTDSALEVFDEIDGAKLKPKVKTYKLTGYTNDPYNTAHKAAQLYNNGVFPLHQKGITGKGVEVAVMDIGFTYVSEIFHNVDWDYAWDAPKNKKLTKTMKSKGEHGNPVTSVISSKKGNGSRTVGVAPDAKILPIRVGETDYFDIENVYKGLQYLDGLLDKGKLKTLRVVNMSFGIAEEFEEWRNSQIPADIPSVSWYINRYEYCKEINDLIQHLHNKHGITFVSAAGNSGGYIDHVKDGKIHRFGNDANFPADCTNVVSVGAHNIYNEPAAFSNCRPTTDLFAFGGDDIFGRDTQLRVTKMYDEHSIYVVGNDGDMWMDAGTSFAAPVVSGIFALLYSANGNLKESDVLKALKSTGTYMNKEDYGMLEVLPKDIKGKNIVNATRAYNKLFGKSLKIDLKYAFQQNRLNGLNKSCVEFDKKHFLGGLSLGNNTFYGLDRRDFKVFKFKSKKSKTRMYYRVRLGGGDFVTRTKTFYSKNLWGHPKLWISGKTVKYEKPENDYLKIRIYKKGKYKKTIHIKSDKKAGKIKLKGLKKGIYRLCVRPYFSTYVSISPWKEREVKVYSKTHKHYKFKIK